MKFTNQPSAAFISRSRLGLLTLLVASSASLTVGRADSTADNWKAPNSNLLSTSNWSTGALPASGYIGVINDSTSSNGNVLGLSVSANPGTASFSALELTAGTSEKVGTYDTNLGTTNYNIVVSFTGATLNSVSDTIIANESSNTSFTFLNDAQPSNKYPNTGTMTLALNNTATNVIQSSGSGNNVVIDTAITGASDSITFLGGGSSSATGGTLELGAGSAADTSSSSNTFSGGITIGSASTNAGIVQIDGTKALPTTGTVTVNTNSQLLLNGSATYGGTTQNLVLNGAGTAATGGAVTTTSGNASTWQGTMNLASESAINVQGATGSFTAAGAISGAGKLDSTGAGTLILSGNNSYQGGTSVTAGTLEVNNTQGSATGSGAVTVSNAKTVLSGSGTIGGGVTLNAGTSLSSGGPQTGSAVTAPGMTLSSTLAVSSANLTFALGTGTATNGSSPYVFSTPNKNSTFINATGTAAKEISFTGTDSITLVDLTGGTLSLRQGTPYLLIAAGADSDYSGLVTVSGFGQNAVYSLDGDGYVVGVAANNYQGGTTINSSDFTPIAISEVGANGSALSGPNSYTAPVLYLDAGQLEVVPEPSTDALVAAGLLLLVYVLRRRNLSNTSGSEKS